MNNDRSVLLLGSPGEFSAGVLSHLAGAGITGLRAAVLRDMPATPAPVDVPAYPLKVRVQHPLSVAAEQYGTPLENLAALTDIPKGAAPPGLIVTACFPRRLPGAILDWPLYGCLNVHPSLLPAYRGPNPVFWQLRAGETMSGVTIHKLDAELDAGDIVATESIALGEPTTAAAITGTLVDAGGRLLAQLLKEHDWDALPGTAQDHAKATYDSWPTRNDFRIFAHWSAERAFRFMHGTAAWGQPYVFESAGKRLLLERALDFNATGALSAPWVRDGNSLRIALKSGVLHAIGTEVALTPGR